MIRPAPYAADVRAKGWRFELDHERIRQSDTWALAPAEIKPWLLMLWMTAWEQAPCGSLPASDELVAARIGMPMKTFAKHRGCLMRGWWLADDGRQYHNTLIERVQEMVKAKNKERDRKAEWRARNKDRAGTDEFVPPLSHGTDTGQTGESHGSPTVRDDTGTGTGTNTLSSLRSDAGIAHATPGEACKAMKAAGMGVLSPSNPKLIALLDAGITVDELADAARDAVAVGKPFAYALATAEGRRRDAATAPLPEARASPSETTYQRSMREKMERVVPGIAKRAPGAGFQNNVIEMEVPAVILECLGQSKETS